MHRQLGPASQALVEGHVHGKRRRVRPTDRQILALIHKNISRNETFAGIGSRTLIEAKKINRNVITALGRGYI
jgi:hypothetical protein